MSQNRSRLSALGPALLAAFFLALATAEAQPKFVASEIAATNNSQLIVCDLDGDGLKDLVRLSGLDLAVFFQDASIGFTREPQQTYHLDARPAVIWKARVGKAAESLLVMTSDGVTELCFTNRTAAPASRQIIRQATLIPENAEETNVLYLPLSAATTGDWPLLLVPTTDGLQVWQHGEAWRAAQIISDSVDAELRPSVADPGYSTSQDLDLSIGDVNGDGRDDLMIRSGNGHGTNIYQLYLQRADGRFELKPALTYADKIEPFTWLSWIDLNRDGKVDLIKGVWLNEASFIPSVPSAKVLIRTYLADAEGRIPGQPQQVFRKNDWVPAVPVLDVDGDGLPDLVLGFNHLESKEDLSREITARRLDYSLRFYFCRPGTGFPASADCQCEVAIHLDHSEALMDWSLPQNFERYVRLGGDFTGNGKTDLLVRDHSDLISVYSFISRERGFSPEPALHFDCPDPIDEWQVLDLNHDGISDLMVTLAGQKGFRIFVSHR